jgi:acyl-CoA thioesterase FadM
MYPYARMLKELWISRNATPLRMGEVHVSHHRCWPWDIDMWMELNNGRTLTLYDLGRIPMARRSGLLSVLRRRQWGLTMAGVTVRYRRRIRTFERIEMRSRALFWDDRFLYIEQSMWKADGECANHALYRAAVTDHAGIVAPARVAEALGVAAKSPEPPAWAKTWIASEAERPWPPMQDNRARR